MTYEKEIPAYALQVARAPKVIPCQAVYHTEKILSPGERQTVNYQFEEDILVPDTREDMAEILLMDAQCNLLPMERNLSAKTDDLVNFSGMITIQTLYRPEKESCLPVSITSKIPYQYQWHLHCKAPAQGIFRCNVKALEHMIINERKFRVKITLEFQCLLLLEETLSLFQGLEEEKLELKTKSISLCCMEAMQKEDLQVDGWVEATDGKTKPVELLVQHYTIVENYRQITSEKIVLNGFIFADFLYKAEGEDGQETICHQRGRIEFTHFLPLEKKHRGRKWAVVKTEFHNEGLAASIEIRENDVPAFHVEGKVESQILFYEAREQEMVTDAYHQSKQFTCTFSKESRKDLVCASTTEVPFRELVNLPEGSNAMEVVCCLSNPVGGDMQIEKGRILLSFKVDAVCLWKNEEGYHGTKFSHQIQQSIEADSMDPSTEAAVFLQIKECRAVLVGDKQVEVSGNLMVSWEGMREKELLLLGEPGFLEENSRRWPAMVITAVEEHEDLWTLAKRHRTTEEQIRQINHLEGDLVPGQKIFIIRQV